MVSREKACSETGLVLVLQRDVVPAEVEAERSDGAVGERVAADVTLDVGGAEHSAASGETHRPEVASLIAHELHDTVSRC